MKKLSLPEFRDFCNNGSFRKIIYATCNQQRNNTGTLSAFSLEFSKMQFTFNPDIIYLTDSRNSMRLNNVKGVKIHDEKCLLGTIFTVICCVSGTLSGTEEYTLIAQ